MYRRRRATGRQWIRCVRIGARHRVAQRQVEVGDDSETRRNPACPASRCGTFSLEIRCDPPIRRACAAAVMLEPAVGADSVTPRQQLRAAISGLRIVIADGAAIRIGQPIARPSRSPEATVSRARPRMVGNGSSLAPIARARVTASSPRRGTRTARDTKVRATRAARAIHGQSGCRSRRRSCASAQYPGVNRDMVAARHERNRLRDRAEAVAAAIAVEVAVAAVRAVEAVGAARAVEAADMVAATAKPA